MTEQSWIKIGFALVLGCGLLLVWPGKGASQVRSGSQLRPAQVRLLPNRFTTQPFLGVRNPPNFQPMQAFGGFPVFPNSFSSSFQTSAFSIQGQNGASGLVQGSATSFQTGFSIQGASV